MSRPDAAQRRSCAEKKAPTGWRYADRYRREVGECGSEFSADQLQSLFWFRIAGL
tara:strand:+ start:226 stop:390 length:165 start_codon:yes stop_codon:yes gene_type:complete